MPLNPDVTLQQHQKRVESDATETAARDDPFRILLNWHMGSGKTLGSLAAAHALNAPYTVVAPAALRTNYKDEEKKFTDKSLPSSIISYHKAIKGNVPPTDTLVVDEAARIGRPSQQSRAVKELADRSKNVILMTGTPITNRPEEFTNLFNILTNQNMSSDEFASRYVKGKNVYPGGFFSRLFGGPTSYEESINNVDELKHLLAGKVDYYSPAKSDVPVNYEDIETEMSPNQSRIYEGIWQRLPWHLRMKLKHDYGLSKDELRNMRSFMVGPRQVSLSDLPFQQKPDPLKAFEGSAKLLEAYKHLRSTLDGNPNSRAIIYSNFVNAGLRPYAAGLAKNNIPHGMFYGDMSDAERKAMVDNFNKGKLRVALVGPAGAEGISLKGSQLIQVLDPHWNDARTRQAIARGLRFDSHTGLPEDLRNVKVQRFISRLPLTTKQKLFQAMGVDQKQHTYAADDYMRRLADRKEQLNQQFLDVLKDLSPKQAEDLSWLMLANGDEILEKTAASVYIVKGNPDVDTDNASKYVDFYNEVKQHVESLGHKAEFDDGLPFTTPPGGDVWLGHSRGADRLRFAPAGVATLRLDDYEPVEARQQQQARYEQLFKALGVNRIVDVPLADRPKPGPEHYTYSPSARDAVTNLLASHKTAAGPIPLPVKSPAGAISSALSTAAKPLLKPVNAYTPSVEKLITKNVPAPVLERFPVVHGVGSQPKVVYNPMGAPAHPQAVSRTTDFVGQTKGIDRVGGYMVSGKDLPDLPATPFAPHIGLSTKLTEAQAAPVLRHEGFHGMVDIMRGGTPKASIPGAKWYHTLPARMRDSSNSWVQAAGSHADEVGARMFGEGGIRGVLGGLKHTVVPDKFYYDTLAAYSPGFSNAMRYGVRPVALGTPVLGAGYGGVEGGKYLKKKVTKQSEENGQKDLRQVKTFSDAYNYDAKAELLRHLIRQSPGSWTIDSEQDHTYGVTHMPTGWRYHIPKPIVSEFNLGSNKEAAGLPIPIFSAPIPKPVTNPAAAIGQALSAAASKLPTTSQLGQLAKSVVKAPQNYVKSMAGFGEGGSLTGQKFLDSTTVKPMLTRAQLKTELASGSTIDQLGKTHQLPTWTSRIPGVEKVKAVGNAINRNPVTHPIYHAGQVANNVLTTPITSPITKPIAAALGRRGYNNAAKGLTGFDKVLSGLSQASGYVGLGSGAVAGYETVKNMPSKRVGRLLDLMHAKNTLTEKEKMENAGYAEAVNQPFTTTLNLAGDDSDLGRMNREIGRRYAIPITQNAAHQQLRQNTDYATTESVLRNMARYISLKGPLSDAGLSVIAEPLDPSDTTVEKAVLAKYAPSLAANHRKNLYSPTGQLLSKTIESEVNRPSGPSRWYTSVDPGSSDSKDWARAQALSSGDLDKAREYYWDNTDSGQIRTAIRMTTDGLTRKPQTQKLNVPYLAGRAEDKGKELGLRLASGFNR